ncbi:MAG TPA: hypothetical protein VFH70_07420 [Acidimicrobiales bacterium]|nr:hypothetical protein [Acidimicrobiales bacterium]
MGPKSVFDRPEDAALDGWPEAAQARVVSVDIRGDRAEVVLDTEPSYPYWIYCRRSDQGWEVTVGGNGPCEGWDDPARIQWGP